MRERNKASVPGPLADLLATPVGFHWRSTRRAPAPPEPPPDVPLVRPFPWEAHYPAGLAWDFAAEPRPLFTLLDDAVATFANRPVSTSSGASRATARSASWSTARPRASRRSGSAGVRVGLFLPNCPYYVICFFAVLKAGGTVVNSIRCTPSARSRARSRIRTPRSWSRSTSRRRIPRSPAGLADTCLKTIVVGSMGGLLPWRERTLFAVLRRREIADVPTDARHVRFKMLIANDGRYAPVAIDPAPTWRCCSTPAAPPDRPRAPCSPMPRSTPIPGRSRCGRSAAGPARRRWSARCRCSTCSA